MIQNKTSSTTPTISYADSHLVNVLQEAQRRAQAAEKRAADTSARLRLVADKLADVEKWAVHGEFRESGSDRLFQILGR